MKQFFIGACTDTWGLWKGAVAWTHREFRDSATNFMRDMRSLKALWNWLFMALFTWECIWALLYDAETCGTTVITCTATLVGAIFTNYVWSSYFEKKAAGKFPALNGTPATPPDRVDGNG